MMIIAALSVGSQLVLVQAQVPVLNVDPSCQAAASSGVIGGTKQSCLNAEMRARDTLKTEWSQFVDPDKKRCVSLTNMGGGPSYVELLTCLQMARDARNLPPQLLDRPIGSGSGSKKQ